MALDYQGRTPAQRYTEENYGTVWLEDDGFLYHHNGRRVSNLVRNLKVSPKTTRVTGQIKLRDDKWHHFSAPSRDDRILLSPLGTVD